MKLLDNLLTADDFKRRWAAVIITGLIAGLLTLWGIYGIGEYGIALFVLTPLFIGSCSSVIYGYNRPISLKEARQIAFLTLLIFGVCLFICAIEGAICILMAAPFALVLTWVGSLIGYAIIARKPASAMPTLIILIALIPLTAFVEKGVEPELTSVVTTIEINADPETVWKNVIEFPQLTAPTELLFKTGIAYPTNARIEGRGVGAVRHCNFTTGSFVEPVTVWDEPRFLGFDVAEQPAPMQELSIWNINSPHLHDYFVSKHGQFKLTALSNGRTLLEGTTWYTDDIKPAFYWKIWSDYIIHKIHQRVLMDIKLNSEKQVIAP